MAETPKNHGKPITSSVVNEVRELAAKNTPIKLIAIKIGRTAASVYGIASVNGIFLKRGNQRSYNAK